MARTAARLFLFSDARVRVLVVVFGAIVLLHREGLLGPKAGYFVLVAGCVALALPRIADLRGRAEASAARRLLIASAALGVTVLLSLPVALRHGTGPVAWTRDAAAYGLLAASPILALDLRRFAGPRWVSWLLLVAGGMCAVSFVVEWLALRGHVSIPIQTILLPSFYLPAGLVAYATARGIRDGRRALVWCTVAAAITAGFVTTGTRTSVLLLAAPLVQLAVQGHGRRLALVFIATVAAIGVGIAFAGGPTTASSGPIDRFVSIATFLRNPGDDPSWTERSREAADAIDSWNDSRIVGVGLGHSFHWENIAGVPQSSFLIDSPAAYLAKLGVVGVLVLGVFAITVVLFIRERRRYGDEAGRTGAEALLGFGAIGLLGFVLGVPLEDKGFALAFLLLTALALPGREDEPVSPGSRRRRALAVAGAAVVACGVAAVLGRATSSTAVALRTAEVASIVNDETPPVRAISSFEHSLWAGDGAEACALLSASAKGRFASTDQCARALSEVAAGDPRFAKSYAVGPIGERRGPTLRYIVHRRDGRAVEYIVRNVAPGDGAWRIDTFRDIRRPDGS